MTEKQIILYCCTKVEDQFGHGPSTEWSHHHFTLLSQTIEKETGTCISETTLKRLFGKRSTESDYIPQLATRDALAKYAGYDNWQDLCQKTSRNENFGKIKDSRSRGSRTKPGLKRYILLAFIILLAIITYIIIIGRKNVPYYSIHIRNQKDTIPFTTVFDYQVPTNTRDSICIDIPEYGKVLLLPYNNVYTHWINEAGYYLIPVEYRDQIIDTLFIHALNASWQSGIYSEEPDISFTPFLENVIDPTVNDLLYISPSKLQKAGIDSLSRYMLEFRLFNDFDVEMDNCIIETIARNSDITGGKPCYDIDIVLIGENGMVRTVFTELKCSRFVQLVIGEVMYNGRNHDLSMFSADISDWTSFRTNINNGKAVISINGNEIFSQAYTQSMGMLKGIKIRFFGSGQARSIKITDHSGAVRFMDDFKSDMGYTNKILD
jgi:hypothetical protein